MIKDVRPNSDGKAQKVKVKVRLNLHGIMSISSASMYEAKNAAEPESPEEQQQEQNGAEDAQRNGDQSAAEGGAATDAPMDGSNGGGVTPPEVGSGTSWTKKISGWFGGVRIRDEPADETISAGLAISLSVHPFHPFLSFYVQFVLVTLIT